MKRALTPILAGLGALALVGLLIYGVTRNAGGNAVENGIADGHPIAISTRALPALSDGRPTSLRSLRGRVVVVNMFASWCGPCQAESPLLERTQRGLRTQDATIVGITWRNDSGDAQSFARSNGLTYPILRDVDSSFGRSLGVTGVPETFVLDRRGRIVAVSRSPLTAQFLRTALAKAARS